MKGIYKRGSIYWIRYAGPDGRIIRESTKSEKAKDAEALLTERKHTVNQGKMPEIKKIKNHTFKELCKEYRKWAERQRSFDSKKYFIAELEKRFSYLPLRRLNSMLIEQMQTDMLQQGKKPSTCNRHVACFSHMMQKAVDWEMVEEGILKLTRKAKLLPENNRRLRYLSKDECKNLINACENHLQPIVITALNTGMRKGEILGLKWDQVDMKHGFILLSITKNGDRREIPINETLKTAFKGITRRLDSPYVFYDPKTGKPYQEIKHSFASAMRRAKIMDFRFHDLRHTFASHLVMAGIDLTTVKELLGHKTLTMTLRYAHLAPGHKVKAVDILDGVLNDKNRTAQKVHNL